MQYKVTLHVVVVDVVVVVVGGDGGVGVFDFEDWMIDVTV